MDSQTKEGVKALIIVLLSVVITIWVGCNVEGMLWWHWFIFFPIGFIVCVGLFLKWLEKLDQPPTNRHNKSSASKGDGPSNATLLGIGLGIHSYYERQKLDEMRRQTDILREKDK
jgi:hypothetical protein